MQSVLEKQDVVSILYFEALSIEMTVYVLVNVARDTQHKLGKLGMRRGDNR